MLNNESETIMTNNKTHFIFRMNDSGDCEYLTADRKTFSKDKQDVLFMTEAEASDNCSNYDTEEWTCGCGS